MCVCVGGGVGVGGRHIPMLTSQASYTPAFTYTYRPPYPKISSHATVQYRQIYPSSGSCGTSQVERLCSKVHAVANIFMHVRGYWMLMTS